STGSGGSVDASFDIAVGDHPADGVCAVSMTPAEPVPLDLYVLMDSSQSMNELTDAGPSKWTALKAAMNSFFQSQSSAGLGVGLKFFPGVQSSAAATCQNDGADTSCGAYGPCDRRKTCVGNNASTMGVSPLCTQASDCPGQTCALIKDCGAKIYCA